MPNKNELLKDIAVALGATVTDKDNDTNELLALIRDNLPSNEPAEPVEPVEPAKLYRHYISMRLEGYETGSYEQSSDNIILTVYANFKTPFESFYDLYKYLIPGTWNDMLSYTEYRGYIQCMANQSDTTNDMYPATLYVQHDYGEIISVRLGYNQINSDNSTTRIHRVYDHMAFDIRSFTDNVLE